MASSRGLTHVPALDGLRGLAVAAVVVFHAGHLQGGYLGVDLFFTLSGFLITSLLLEERSSTGSTDLGYFWSRRARRLLPALLAVLLVMLVYARWFAQPFELDGLRRQALASLFYVANWNSISTGADYWARASGPSPLQHTWSLAIEEQFYLVWPLVFLGAWALGVRAVRSRRPGEHGPPDDRTRAAGTRRVLLFAVVLAVLSSGLMLFGRASGIDLSRLYFGSDTRFSSILVGCALACLLRLRRPVAEGRPRRALEAGATVSLLAIGIAWLTVDGQSAFVYLGGLTILAVGAAVVIASVVHPDPGPVSRVLSFAPFCWLGLISYGLYLWHWPVLQIMDADRMGFDGGPLLAFQLSLSLLLAIVSFFAIERPIRRGQLVTTAQAKLLVPAFVVLLAVMTFSLVRTPEVDVAALLGPIPAASGRFVDEAGAPRPPRVLIVGDSVGDSLAKGVAGRTSETGVDVRNRAGVGCGVQREVTRIRLLDGTIGPDGEGCAALIDGWTADIERFRPDVIGLVLGFPGGLDKEVQGTWTQPCDPRFQAWYRPQLIDAISTLQASGTPVAITTVPYKKDGVHPAAERDRDTDCLNQLYRGLTNELPSLSIVDLQAYVCPEGRCRPSIDGYQARPDGLHFFGPSSAIAGSWLTEQLLEVAESAPRR